MIIRKAKHPKLDGRDPRILAGRSGPGLAGWTRAGACTRGSTARDGGATKPVSGCAATTSTPNLSRAVDIINANGAREISRRMVPQQASQRAFFGVSALLFAASAAVTIVWCTSVSAMGEMPMPGGWTMSMRWMSMPGQTLLGAAVSFLGMWIVMMIAMMLPCLVPMLWRYRQAIGRTGKTRLGWLGVGYFLVWTVFGIAAFPLGAALAHLEMKLTAVARAVPMAFGVVVLIAGAHQFTTWKAHHLASCREEPGRGSTLQADAGTAWRHGLRLGCYCYAGLTAILLAIGVMDLRVMAVVTAAITVERLAPDGERVARAIGAVVVGAGLFLIARAAGLGSRSCVAPAKAVTMGVTLRIIWHRILPAIWHNREPFTKTPWMN
jgi:predicted metal-binding membrane protein